MSLMVANNRKLPYVVKVNILFIATLCLCLGLSILWRITQGIDLSAAFKGVFLEIRPLEIAVFVGLWMDAIKRDREKSARSFLTTIDLSHRNVDNSGNARWKE